MCETMNPNPIPAAAPQRPIRVGVWNYYEEITRDGFLFKNSNVAVGANLLKPWCDLYERGQALGIQFLTLDQIQSPADLDAVLFMDRPRPGRPLIDAIMQSPIKKYLMLFECDVIKPDNWDIDYHRHFDRIFTWNDDLIDGQRYVKINFAAELKRPYEFSALKQTFAQRKLATVIAGAKVSRHPNELYSERVRAIRWFEHNAPADFDLYGMGWDAASYPSYKGPVDDKLATLSDYRFSICYENARDIPGYITEKALDCLRAGTVPVYLGAPNITRWIPADCFIDLRRFGSYPELHGALSGMQAAEHGAYLDRIAAFLNGPGVHPFSSECFVDTVTGIVNEDLRSGNLTPSESPGQAAAGIGTVPPAASSIGPAAAAPETTNAQTGQETPAVAEQRRLSIAKAGRPDLIVYFGYGDELPVFTRARALWQFYISHFPGVSALFVRTSKELPLGVERKDGNELIIGVGAAEPNASEGGYASSGVWSAAENRDTIYRQQAVYKHLLRENPDPFFLYQTTITSVIDFRGLTTVLENMPRERCFAGSMGRLNSPGPVDGLTLVSGANTLISSDLMRRLADGYDPAHPFAAYPNDVWQALMLDDVGRRPVPFFSFTLPRDTASRRHVVPEITRRMLEMGHFHFRIKTRSSESRLGPREDVDPWVMLAVMDAILQNQNNAPATQRLLEQQLAWISPPDGVSQPSFSAESIYRGPRTFLLHDEEVEAIHPDLAHRGVVE